MNIQEKMKQESKFKMKVGKGNSLKWQIACQKEQSVTTGYHNQIIRVFELKRMRSIVSNSNFIT